MSSPKKLGQIVEEREYEQGRKSAARMILTEVKDWRGKHVNIAKRRWIWELIQNAVDCGTREQRDVEANVTLDNNSLVFEHNGGPFLPEEISALILGGSTKPFAPESPYAGRFGIGFLVTHILSLKVNVEGTAKTNMGEKSFRLLLDRSGNNVDEILDSIKKCYKLLDEEVEERIPNTKYTYHLGEQEFKAPAIPISELKKLLPFVMLFQERLKGVCVRSKSFVSSWKLQNRFESNMPEGEHLIGVTVKYTEEISGKLKTQMIDAIGIRKDDVTCAISVLDDGTKRTCIVDYDIPKIFAPYPLIGGTEKIGIPIVISGSFEPSKDRDTVLISESESAGVSNRQKIRVALGLVPKLLKYALDSRLDGLHRLARVRRTSDVPKEYQQWWNDILHEVVLDLINSDIVETTEGFKKPVEKNLWFLVPLLKFDSDVAPETEQISQKYFGKFWDFDAKVYESAMRVRKHIALEWQLNVRHWLDLAATDELKIKIWSIEDVCKWFEEHKEQELEDIKVEINDLHTLIEILESTKDTARETAVAFLRDYPIMPNQNGKLGYGKDFFIDNSISEELKDIAESFDYALCDELLNNSFNRFAIVNQAVFREKDEDSVIDTVIAQIPRAGSVDDEKANAIAKLLVWLTQHKPESNYVENVPIVASDGELRYFAGEPIALLPLKMLDKGEHYDGVYPKGRLMSSIYSKLTNQTSKPSFVSVLINKHMIYSSMLVYRDSCKLRSRELRSIILQGEKVKTGEHNVKPVEGGYLQDIAFFNPDLIGALGHDIERTKRFIRLLLVELKEAEEWKKSIEVSCSCGRMHKAYPAIWLAHFKTKKWIPVKKEEDGEESIEPSRPSKEVLEELLGGKLKKIVLDENGIELLKHLGFDELDLKIRKVHIETNQSIDTIKTLLSNIVESGELSDIQQLMKLDSETRQALIVRLQDLEEKRRVVEANKAIGKIVEGKIEEILGEREDITVVPQYAGCDLKAYIRGDLTDEDVIQDLGHCVLDPFYIEIKKTISNRARITKAQAALAVEKGENYVLCIVQVPSDKLTQENIIQHTFMIPDVGEAIKGITQPSEYVEPDVNGYWIKSALWEKQGMTIDEWIENVKDKLKSSS